MERWPEDFLGLNLNPNRGGNVALRTRLNHGKQPAFILKGSAQTKNPRRPVIPAHANISQGAAPGNVLLADLLMAEIHLHAIPRAKPVVRPSLRSLSLAANPTP